MTTTTTTSAARMTREERAALRAPLPESYRSLPQAEVDALWRSGSKIEQKRLGRAGLLPSWLRMSPNRAGADVHEWIGPTGVHFRDVRSPGGTFYHDTTPPEVVAALDGAMRSRARVRIFYGDRATGRDWLEENDVTGTVGRSGGQMPIPILLPTSRSTGGGGILTDSIVRLIVGGREVYRHPSYHQPSMEIQHGSESRPFAVAVDGAVQAQFKTETAANRWIAFLRGERMNKAGHVGSDRAAPDEPSLPVMFRVSKDADREVAAVFPTLPGTNDPSTVTVYAHVGQHGSAPWSYVRDRTRPATEAEYAPLLREVRSIYEGGPDPVRLRVVQRATRAMYDERRRAAGF